MKYCSEVILATWLECCLPISVHLSSAYYRNYASSVTTLMTSCNYVTTVFSLMLSLLFFFL